MLGSKFIRPYHILFFDIIRWQAVKGDPRVTKIGKLLRKTNLDELSRATKTSHKNEKKAKQNLPAQGHESLPPVIVNIFN